MILDLTINYQTIPFYVSIISVFIISAFFLQALSTQTAFSKLNASLSHALTFIRSNIDTSSLENAWNIITAAMHNSPQMKATWDELLAAIGKIDLIQADGQQRHEYNLLVSPETIISKDKFIKANHIKKLSLTQNHPFWAGVTLTFFLLFETIVSLLSPDTQYPVTMLADGHFYFNLGVNLTLFSLILGHLFSLLSLKHRRSCEAKTERLCGEIVQIIVGSISYFPVEHGIFSNYRCLHVQNELIGTLSNHIKELTRVTFEKTGTSNKSSGAPVTRPNSAHLRQ